MRTRQLWVAFVVAAIFIFGGFLDVRSETQKEEQEGYKKQIEERLHGFALKIKELEKKGAKVKETSGAEYRAAMKELKGEEIAAKKKWQELNAAGAREWDKVRSEMDRAVQSLETSYKKTISRIEQ